MTRAIHADGLITGDREAIRDAAVIVSDDSVIVDVGPAAEVLPRHAGLRAERIHGVVFPGLVNAHTHIELSALRGRVAGGAGFVAWVDRFLRVRHELGDGADGREDADRAIAEAVEELDRAATTAVGDVTNTLAAVHALARRGMGGSVFHEVFGASLESTLARFVGLPREVAERVGAWPTSDLRYAPAPHTLYTTHPDVVRALVKVAREAGARTSIHLAEHAAERRALEEGDGPMVAWLALRAGVFAWPKMSPIAYADELGVLAPDVLAVHLTDARSEELHRVAARGAPVILCPRSNLFIEVKLPPLLAMRAAGIEPALGTDSLASNASLDVLAEAKALAERFPGVPPRELLQMATWNGARALGRKDLGRVSKGSRPGLAAIDGSLSEPAEDPCAFALRNVRAPRRWLARRTPAPVTAGMSARVEPETRAS